MAKQFKTLGVVLLLMGIFSASCFPSAIQGELNGGLNYEWNKTEKSFEQNSTLTGFRLVFEDYLESAGKVHFSAKGWWDWKLKDGQITLDQLWLSSYVGDVDFKVGRQALSWGTADGFNPTNYFARFNMNSLVSGDLGGEPLWAGQVSYYAPEWSVTAVALPYFVPQMIDQEMKDIMLKKDPGMKPALDAIEKAEKPRSLGKDTEFGLRVETQIQGFDLQASFFTGFEPLPALETVITIDPLNPLSPPKVAMEGQYRRQYFVGLAATGTVGPVGVWGEVSYGGPQLLKESTNPLVQRIPLSINEKYAQAVLGGDYTINLGSGLLMQAQYVYRGQGGLLAPYVEPDLLTLKPGKIEAAHYLYGRLGYDFSTDSSVGMVILYDLSEKGGLIRPAYTHRFPNSVQLEASVIGVYGKGDLANIPQQARLALSYKF